MDKATIVKTVKEKGPIFAVGAIVGVLVIAAVFHREKIKETMDNTLRRLSSRGIKNEPFERS